MYCKIMSGCKGRRTALSKTQFFTRQTLIQHTIARSFGLKDEIHGELKAAYESALIAERCAENNNTLVRSGLTIKLASAFGFCWGVDRAVSIGVRNQTSFSGPPHLDHQ